MSVSDLSAEKKSSTPSGTESLYKRAKNTVESAKEFLFSIQRDDHRWCGELESNPTITAEYVYLNQILARDQSEYGAEMVLYFRNIQNEDGSWGIARQWLGDISTTAEVYLALRILGVPIEDVMLKRAEYYILKMGGLEKVRVFTRINFALFGLIPWDAIPALPPEVILLPPQFPINIYALSSWARGTMVPLFVIFHYQPIYALPNGKSENNPWLDHLWINAQNKNTPYTAPWSKILQEHGLTGRSGWKQLFSVSDRLLKKYEKIHLKPLRRMALKRCLKWILDRQEDSGDWAGIFPPMFNGIVALFAHGYGVRSEQIQKGLKAVDHFSWSDDQGFRIQACVSPVWDTALASIGLFDSGVSGTDPRMEKAIEWLCDRQIRVEHGDWKVYRPRITSGGWSFEYFNTWYPDVDDTAAVMLAILKQDPNSANEETIRRATEWVLGMQNKDGGWAAFDVDNDKEFLNEIPFADIDALCDQSCPDITGRVIEAFAYLLKHLTENGENVPFRRKIEASADRGLEYLSASQEDCGSWFGRWGVNYIYGTSNVLCGLSALDIPSDDSRVKSALPWLLSCQNEDGGWGESVSSYSDRSFMGKGTSTPSQTAWALMGLLSYLSADHPAVERGVQWLIAEHQTAEDKPEFQNAKESFIPVPPARGKTWKDPTFTGTGFPKHFYLRYHLYAHYFPMMALGRFIERS